MKREEDNLQKEMFLENRKKAMQRLREYKLVNIFFFILDSIRNFTIYFNHLYFVNLEKLQKRLVLIERITGFDQFESNHVVDYFIGQIHHQTG